MAINREDRATVLGYANLINLRGGDTYRVDVERHGHDRWLGCDVGVAFGLA